MTLLVKNLPSRHIRPPTPQTPTATVYCDAAAAGSGDGTSGTPFTLAEMLSNLAAGQLVYLKGNFTSSLNLDGKSGSATEWIIFRRWPEEEVQAKFTTSTISACTMRGQTPCSYIVVEDTEFESTDISSGAIYIYRGTHHIHIYNCTVQSSRVNPISWTSGITIGNPGVTDAGVNNIWIDSCTIDNVGSVFGEANSGDGIWVSSGLTNITDSIWIVRNTVHNCGHAAISSNGGGFGNPTNVFIAYNTVDNTWSGGIATTGMLRGIIEGNKIFNTGTLDPLTNDPNTFEGLVLKGQVDCIARHNVIWNCYGAGIFCEVNLFSGINQQFIGNRIYNNTVVNCGGSLILLTRVLNAIDNFKNNIFCNNLFWSCHEPEDMTTYDIGAGNRSSYFSGNYQRLWIEFTATTPWPSGDLNGNIFKNNWFARDASNSDNWALLVGGNGGPYTLAQFEALNESANNVDVGDPLFKNIGADDFTLQSTSPCLNAGIIIPGQSYRGSAPNIGAY